MKLKDAKKVLDGLSYDPARGTRRLDPETRATVKAALAVFAEARELYHKKRPPKKAVELETEG